MTDQETTLIIQDIISKAVEGKAQLFRPILYWSEYCYYCRLLLSTDIIIRTLTRAANNLFKAYCKDIIAGTSDITTLIAYQQLLDVIDFYNDDLETLQSMIEDYKDYLFDFRNFVGALLGERRLL